MKKTQLAEKRYRDKNKKDKIEIKLNNKKPKKQVEKIEKIKDACNKYNHHLQKQNRQQNYQRRNNTK